MTRIGRSLSRCTNGEYKVLYTKALPIVVTIQRGDTLVFRHLRHRARFELAIDDAFRWAVWKEAAPRLTLRPKRKK